MTRLTAGALCLLAFALVFSCGDDADKRADRGVAGEGAVAGEAAAAGEAGMSAGGSSSEAGSGSLAGAEGGADGVAGAGEGEGGAFPAGAGGAALGGAGGGEGGAAPVVLPEGAIVNVAYSCESPFQGVEFPSYFHLENFEQGALTTPGVTAAGTTMSSSFGAGLVDSVDCDDGAIDEQCVACDALYGNGTIEVVFDAQSLGELPSHVGMVWTDGGGGATVTITGFDSDGIVIYTQAVEGIGDGSIYGTTAEDRFFGIVSFGGVARVQIVNSTGGVEIDHLQYGR